MHVNLNITEILFTSREDIEEAYECALKEEKAKRKIILWVSFK